MKNNQFYRKLNGDTRKARCFSMCKALPFSENLKKTQPLVSILLPVCNNEEFLLPCLESLSSQTYKNIEIIVIDDDSKDNSFKILKSYKKREKRLRLYRNKKRYGLSITLNRCIKRVKGSFIAFMNPNDINSPFRIKTQLTFLLSHPKTAVTGTQCVFINTKNRQVDKSFFPTSHIQISKTLLNGSSFQFETAMINKYLLPRDILRFNINNYPLIFADVFTKLLAYGDFANLSKALYRRRKDSKTGYSDFTKYEHTLSTIKLWLKSVVEYDYRPSLNSLLSPRVKQA